MSEQTQNSDQTKNPPTPPAPTTTNMTAPTAPRKTELVAPKSEAKPLRKMEILRDTQVFLPDASKDKDGKPIAVVKVKGEVVDVTEEEALRLVNKKVSGGYGFTGERTGDFPKQVLRAARPWQPTREEIAKRDPLDPANFAEHVV